MVLAVNRHHMGRVLIVLMLAGCSFTARAAPTGGGGDVTAPDAPMVFDGPDAVVDASGPPITGCPSSYTLQVAGSTSWYRIAQSGVWWDVSLSCNQDQTGRTHLVVLETTAERLDVAAMLAMRPATLWHVGAVQDMNQSMPASGWHWLTGGSVPVSAWSVGKPDDGNGSETNKRNLAVLDPLTATLSDDDSLSTNPPTAGGLCECDGQPISAAVAAQIPPDNS